MKQHLPQTFGSRKILQALENRKVQNYTPLLQRPGDDVRGMAFSVFGAMGASAKLVIESIIAKYPQGTLPDPESWLAPTHKRRVWQSLSCAFHCAQTLTYHSVRSTVARSKRPTWGVPPAPDFRG